MTYALTITNFPSGAAYPGYQAHIFLVPGASIPNYETAPDYTENNLIFLDIHQNPDGTAYGAFRYKTNQPNGNGMVYGSGSLGYAGSSTVLGTWSLTFDQDTNITVLSPHAVPPRSNYPQREDTRPLNKELTVNPKRDRSGRDPSTAF